MAILLDTHVHYHPGFVAHVFLDAAWRNLRSAVGPSSGDAQNCLCLTEGNGEHAFERLRRTIVTDLGDWRISATAEAQSLVARRRDDAELLLVAGRQIVTREGLEVLALGGDPPVADGGPIHEVIFATRAAGAAPVLPWGFGKWTFRRGRVVAALLAESRSPDLFLGDNGGRAAAFGPPVLFAAAAAHAVWILPGSDPLPFVQQQERVGSYGCVLPGALDPARPADSLLQSLRSLGKQPETFGRLQALPSFLQAQLRMQWRKRRKALA